MRRVHFTSQLPTSSADITSKADSAGPGNLSLRQDLFKCSQSRQAWGSEFVPMAITVFGGIVDDQVHHAQAKNLPISRYSIMSRLLFFAIYASRAGINFSKG